MRTEHTDGVPLIIGSTQRRIAWSLFVIVVVTLSVQAITSVLSIVASDRQHLIAERTLTSLETAAELQRADQASTVRLVKNTCDEKSYLVRDYCDRDTPTFERCFALLELVEGIIRFESRDVIFAHLRTLEPQTGPITVWAVDESTPFEDSHLDLWTQQTAEYFNNSAYFYTQQVHVRSVGCGGWSLGFWKTLRNETTNSVSLSLQLAYCRETTSNIRVCGAFDVRATTTTV